MRKGNRILNNLSPFCVAAAGCVCVWVTVLWSSVRSFISYLAQGTNLLFHIILSNAIEVVGRFCTGFHEEFDVVVVVVDVGPQDSRLLIFSEEDWSFFGWCSTSSYTILLYCHIFSLKYRAMRPFSNEKVFPKKLVKFKSSFPFFWWTYKCKM